MGELIHMFVVTRGAARDGLDRGRVHADDHRALIAAVFAAMFALGRVA